MDMTDSTALLAFTRGTTRRFLIGMIRSLAPSLVLSVACTLVVYTILRPHFPTSSVIPLLVASLFPLAGKVVSIASRRCAVRVGTVFWDLLLLGDFALAIMLVLTLPVIAVLALAPVMLTVIRLAGVVISLIQGRRFLGSLLAHIALDSDPDGIPA